MKAVIYKNLELIPYKEALVEQEKLHMELIQHKLHVKEDQSSSPGYFILCEHPHVITLGKSGALENLLLGNMELKEKGVEFFHSSRGGDITYHGPGQIVGYPILDLEKFRMTVKKYMYALEELIIRTLGDFGIIAGRVDGMTGVWLDGNHPAKARKICAMGVKISRYVSMHGFALNVNTDLDYFQLIVPCGIEGKAVTSLENELKRKISLEEVHQVLLKKFEELFGVEIRTE